MRRDCEPRCMRDQVERERGASASKEQTTVRDDKSIDKSSEKVGRDGGARWKARRWSETVKQDGGSERCRE